MTDLDRLEEEAQELQRKWAATWQDSFAAELLVVMVDICKILLKDLLAKNRLVIVHETFVEKAQDAATRLWFLMKRDAREECYRVRSFKSRLYLEVKFQMYHPSAQVQAPDVTANVEYHKAQPIVYSHQDEWDEVKSYPQGNKIILILFRSVYYKRAILQIEKFMGRAWCYAHAHALDILFKHTRKPK